MAIEEVTEQGWLSRIAGSIKGILTGLLLFFVAIPIVFFNECSAVDRADDLEVGQGAVVKAQAAKLDSGNEGKLVHLSGAVEVSEKVTDDKFFVTANALELKREVEMFQWQENKEKKTKKKAGGKTVTKTTYTYEKTWSSSVIGSSSFKEEGHDNPESIPFESASFVAKSSKLGEYKLSPKVANKVGSLTDHSLKKSDVTKVPADLKLKFEDGVLYRGDDASSPSIGDVRISFKTRNPGNASIIAGQYGDTLRPFADEDLNDPLVIVSDTVKTPEEMFEEAESTSAMITWILRFVTFLMMFGGLALVFKPLSVIADVIPFIGNLVNTGTNMVAFLIAAPIWFFCVAAAWVVARPLLGIALIVGGIVAIALLVVNAMKNGAKKVAGAVKNESNA